MYWTIRLKSTLRKIVLGSILLFISASLVILLIQPTVVSQPVETQSQLNTVIQDVQKAELAGAKPQEINTLLVQLNSVIALQSELNNLPPQEADKKAQLTVQVSNLLSTVDLQAIQLAATASQRTQMDHVITYLSGLVAAAIGTVAYYSSILLWRKYRVKRTFRMSMVPLSNMQRGPDAKGFQKQSPRTDEGQRRSRRKPVTVRQLLSILLILLLLFEIAAYATTITIPSEKSFQLYMLGSNETAGNYYPNNSSYLQLGENVSWHLGIVNEMGSVQFIAIRVKLGNLTIEPPNNTLATPSPAPFITEFKEFLPNNGTWEMPFNWQVTNYTTTANGHILTLNLTINNMTYMIQNPPSCPVYSCNFRLIFELWTWNVDTANFQIGWTNDGEQKLAWLELWFNLAPGIYGFR